MRDFDSEYESYVAACRENDMEPSSMRVFFGDLIDKDCYSGRPDIAELSSKQRQEKRRAAMKRRKHKAAAQLLLPHIDIPREEEPAHRGFDGEFDDLPDHYIFHISKHRLIKIYDAIRDDALAEFGLKQTD